MVLDSSNSLYQPNNSLALQEATTEEYLPPISRWITLGGITLLIAFISSVILASILEYKVTVKAPAQIRPTGELSLVEAATEGTVESLEVQPHQKVNRGEVIAYLDDSRLQTQKHKTINNIAQLRQQLNQIQAQIEALNNKTAAEIQQINHIIALSEAQLNRSQRDYQNRQISSQTEFKEAEADLIAAQKQLQEAQVELQQIQAQLQSTQAAFEAAKSKQNRYQKAADQGAISLDLLEEVQLAVQQQQQAVEAQKAAVEKQKQTIERLEQSINSATARLRRAQSNLNPSSAEVTIAKEKIAQEQAKGKAILANLNQEKEQLIQQQIEIQKQLDDSEKELQQIQTELEKTTIRASASGVIQQLNIRNRSQLVNTGDLIAQIVPQNATLEIKALVPTQEINRVKIGQKVQMRVSACPYPDYGTLKGKVSAISSDAIAVESQPHNSLIPSELQRKSIYNVVIIPDSYVLSSQHQKCQIKPGMEGRVNIISEQETILKLILRKTKLWMSI